ncbi:hypothetical protein [Undibacterium sp.]|uniref:hypothetical protein n=1 Tax=Undibacterium sp. TaxID=1914977 RepID=UPI00374CA78F
MTKRLALAAFLLVNGVSAMASANPGYYLVSVYDNKGEKSVDFRYWTTQFPGKPETIWPELGLGYGVTSRWYTEFFASYIGSHSALGLDTWNWQNDYLLTQGQYDVDVALHTNLARAHNQGEGYTLEIGPALQTEVGRIQLNANLFFERVFHADDNGTTQLQYQWQAKYRWKAYLETGLQGFGELGDWNHWVRDRQSHRAGPVVSGIVPVGASQAFKYQLAYLKGSIYGSHGNMLSLRLQYVF